MTMDMEKVVLKFRQNEKKTHTVAYCEEYPQVQGIGPSEQLATANFWKVFNKASEQEAHDVSAKKKEEKVAQAKNDAKNNKGTQKKAA
jgi:hypothetical protein